MRNLLAVVFLSSLVGHCVPADAADSEPKLRRPVALAASGDGKWLYAANRDSGSVSIIDIEKQTVAGEQTVGGRLSDLVRLDDHHLLVLDEKNHQLVLLAGQNADWQITARQTIAPSPVRLRLSSDGKGCFVASLWARTVSRIDLDEAKRNSEPRLVVAKTRDLSFEPREMCLTNDGKRLIVADAFGGKVAVLDAEMLEPISIKTLPGHNIRGLALGKEGDRLLIAQQELNPLARSTQDDVHWGNLLMNLLVSVSLEDLSKPEADAKIHRIPMQLGGPGRATGDPGAIQIGPRDKMAVMLSGVNEIALAADAGDIFLQRIPVGQRPVAAAFTPDGRLFVANMFSDTISIVDTSSTRPIGQISLGDMPPLRPEEQGEVLFFDSRLSHDGWMSCQSCHADGHSNDLVTDNLSDGSFGAPKRVLSLLGVKHTGPWAWSGEVKTLEQQVINSIEKTMQGGNPSQEQIDALVAYLKTLEAPPSDSSENKHAADIESGKKLFQSLDCRNCHAPPHYTTPGAYDVGLKDEVGNEKFNPPSLRGVGRRRALFHDGRAKSLEDVFGKHNHQLPRELSDEELEQLLRFLRSL